MKKISKAIVEGKVREHYDSLRSAILGATKPIEIVQAFNSLVSLEVVQTEHHKEAAPPLIAMFQLMHDAMSGKVGLAFETLNDVLPGRISEIVNHEDYHLLSAVLTEIVVAIVCLKNDVAIHNDWKGVVVDGHEYGIVLPIRSGRGGADEIVQYAWRYEPLLNRATALPGDWVYRSRPKQID